MLNKNDPLIGAVQEVMKKNQAEREAAKLVNEKFGVHDRKALPHEKQGEWDAAFKSVLNEGVEALDEAKLSPEHKSIITQKLQKIHGKGKVKFGPNGATWSDRINQRTHDFQVDRKTGKVKMDSSPYLESELEEEKLVGNQPNIDVASADGKKKPDGKLTKHDFEHLRSMKEGNIDEDMDLEKRNRGRKILAKTKKMKAGPIRDFGELIGKRSEKDAVTGDDSAGKSVKAMNQLYGKMHPRKIKNMMKGETVEEMVNPTSAPTSQTPASTVRKAAVKQNVRMGGNPTGAASSQTPASTVRKAAVKQNVRMGGNPTGSPVRPSSSKGPMEEDVTSPSGMGIKGPDYAPAGTKPDYAVRKTVGPKSDLIKKPTMSSGNSTVTQTGKTSSSATKSTMKEENLEEKITAKTDIGSAIEDFKRSESPQLAGRSLKGRREAAIAAVLRARRKAKEKMNEGFNNRHGLSVTASAKKQAVAEAAIPGTPAAQAAVNRSNSMLYAQQRVRNAEAIQSRLAAQRSRANAASTTDVAPRPQPNMALQRQRTGDIAPRPQQGSVALQRQRTGDIAPRPSTAAAPKPADRPNDLGKAPVPGTGGRLAPAAPAAPAATAPKPTPKPVQAAKKPAAAAPVKNASTRGGTMSQSDANVLAKVRASGGQKLSKTLPSGRERLKFFAARNAERRGP